MARPKGTKNPANPEWVPLAWAAWLQGKRNVAALAREFGVQPRTVKANIQKYSRQRAVELADGTDPTAEYLDGLEADLRAADKIVRDTTNDNARIGALKHVTDLREKLAAARGVVTKRQATEVSGGLEIHAGGARDALIGKLNSIAQREAEAQAAGEPD